MDPRLLDYYNRELQFIREMGAEFAIEYPRIAARLGMDGLECADPYVERLIESVAFLAARVQLKIDSRHPDFTQHLLEMVYPHVLAPVPSCGVVQLSPSLTEGSLKGGYCVARGSALRTVPAKGERRGCEYRTAHDVTLWPLAITEARYLVGTTAIASPGLRLDSRVRGAIRLRLQAGIDIPLQSLPLDSLVFYISATADVASKIHEQVHANCVGVLVRPVDAASPGVVLPPGAVRPMGYEDHESLLPPTDRSFQGYRLLQEYFAFPDRFLFFAIDGLRAALASMPGREFEIALLLDRTQSNLENALDAQQFRLNCTPIVNLFPRSLDRIHLSPTVTEQHVVPDRNRPMDFEVHSIQRVTGIGVSGESVVAVLPFYSTEHRTVRDDTRAYYTVQRRPRLPSLKQLGVASRSGYLGTELFLSLSDSEQRHLAGELKQLDITALCTNRDLPVGLSFGKSRMDFVLEGGAPVESIQCLAGPTLPRESPAFGDTAWRLIGQLSLNYLSLMDTNAQQGAEMLRQLLGLYAAPNDTMGHRQIDGVRHVRHKPVVRRVPGAGPIAYGRGLSIDVTVDDSAYEGSGSLRLGFVLERFFSRYVSLNSFVEVALQSSTRGEVKRWPVRIGTRQAL
jgi:type VI secretion system protein ImpG